MTQHTQHTSFNGRLLIIGFGSIGQGVLPLILRHLNIDSAKITVIAADARGKEEAEQYGVHFLVSPVTQKNFKDLLPTYLGKGDFLLNLSVNVSSVALVTLCRELGALYLDTCVEPWEGAYTDSTLSVSQRSNYALRESALALQTDASAPTAVVGQGANPGLVSQFLKQALVNLAHTILPTATTPRSKKEWAELCAALGVKTIHIAERDTQVTTIPKEPGEFVNTWSIDGFHSEGCQPSEMGWGTHEKKIPSDGGQHTFGRGSAIFRNKPGYTCKVFSWTPHAGSQIGWVITHNESISMSDFFTVRDEEKVLYRPTVHYAYNPCPDAVLSLHELAGHRGVLQEKQRLLMEEIVQGEDELGVLLMSTLNGKTTAYWYGSQLSIEQARALAPYNNATSLQVCAGVLGGLVWAIENPNSGLVEADDIDYERVLEVAQPYLGDMVGAYTDWTPLTGRHPEEKPLFPEDLDFTDPWQFQNFLVN